MGAKNGPAASASSRKPVTLSAREGFALWSRTYDDALNPVVSLIDRHMEIPPGLLIDVACGTGRWVDRSGGIGADLSIEMLRKAPRRVAQADARRLPFRDGIADAAICILALGYVSPPEAAIDEMHRITRAGGTIIAADFHPAAIAAGWQRSFRDGGMVYDIEHHPYIPDGALDLFFGEPERLIYEWAGKSFEEVRDIPAVWIKRWLK